MADHTKVYLITGFLGSGKTTLLNRIINNFPKDQKLMVLMNEFGEIGIDGTLIESDELEMMEISRGSIFCVCVKSDFIKGLHEIAQKIAPDVLIIESTGVANPSDLKRDLKLSIFKDRFQFTEQFCLIDAHNFLDAYAAYASLEKQIASSTRFIINKVDLASQDTLEEIKRVVQTHHPDPEFYETTYADIPWERFFLPEAAMTASAEDHLPRKDESPPLSEEELERFIDRMLDSMQGELTPPDLLMSAAYRWTGEELDEIRALAAQLPPTILRCKGFLSDRHRTYLLSYVMGDWSLEETAIADERIEHKNVLVFIGSPEGITALEQITAPGHWIKLGAFQPMARV